MFTRQSRQWAVVDDANGGGEGSESIELVGALVAEAVEQDVHVGRVLLWIDEENECAGEVFIGPEESEEAEAAIFV